MIKVRNKRAPVVKGKPHSLKANRKSGRPINLLFLDTETKIAFETDEVQYQQFRLGVTCFVRRRYGIRSDAVDWKDHHDLLSICREIEGHTSKKTCLYVFVSNPSFDMWIIKFYSWFAARGWKASFVYDEGMRYILICRQENRVIKVLAMQNFCGTGISKVGKRMGIEKGEVDHFKADTKTLLRYCKRDVEILMRAILEYIDFCDAQNVGGWGLTLASQAMNAFRYAHLTAKFWVHRDADILSLERRAYFGAMTEPFFIGECKGGPFVDLDVNSLYPHVMHENLFPISLKFIVKDPPMDVALKCCQKCCVAADVVLDTKLPWWAAKVDNWTCFQTGEFETSVCTEGLRRAIETGSCKKIHKLVVYTAARPFVRYVEHFGALKEQYKREGKLIWSDICKLFLNALYGKFGQAPPNLVEVYGIDDTSFARTHVLPAGDEEAKTITQIMGTVFVEQGRHEHRDSMPVVAAHITEYARFYMVDLIERVGRRKVLYCDTDGFCLRKKHAGPLEGLIHPTKMGALKVEKEGDTLTIHGPKDYVFDGERVIKGVPTKAKELSPGVFQVQRWPKLKTLLTTPVEGDVWEGVRGSLMPEAMLDLQRDGLYPVVTFTKTLKRECHKGTVLKSGRVKPYHAQVPLPF